MTNNKKRSAAGLIDLHITIAIKLILGYLFVVKPLIAQEIGFNLQIIILNVKIILIALIYMVIRDLFGGRSVGKRILKLKVVDANSGEKATPLALFLRNTTWLLGPVEAIVLVTTDTRLGDRIAKTKVVHLS